MGPRSQDFGTYHKDDQLSSDEAFKIFKTGNVDGDLGQFNPCLTHISLVSI